MTNASKLRQHESGCSKQMASTQPIPPCPFVILEWTNEAGSGDPISVLLPVKSGRCQGVAGVKNVSAAGGNLCEAGVAGRAGSVLFAIRCRTRPWGCWTGILLSTKGGPGWRPQSPHWCKGVRCLGTLWGRCGSPPQKMSWRYERRQRNRRRRNHHK